MQTALRSAFPALARRLAVLAALVLAMIRARTVVLYAPKSHVHLPGALDMRYQRLRRFVQFQLPDGPFTCFAFACLPEGDLELILDCTFVGRTDALLGQDGTRMGPACLSTPAGNWKLGQQDVNLLLLSAVWSEFSLPLIWTIFPQGGSSSQVLREELLTRFLTGCPDRKITGLLADREFVGKIWFKFLDTHGIPPCIRLPACVTVGIGGMPVWACFKKLQPEKIHRWHRPIQVYGVYLRICATNNMAGEILYLAYRGRAGIHLKRYSRRWQAENLHSALKSRGFNLEDTGVTQAERISTLMTAVSIAFIWACLTGELLAAKTPPKRKKHGHRAVSVFRLGLDHLQDLLPHSS